MNPQQVVNLSTSCSTFLRRLSKVFIILTAFASLTSCIFSANQAPTSDLSRVTINKSSNSSKPTHHKVLSGETLFSIAWRYGLDYRALARRNGIGDDFLIYAGQTLKLQGKASGTSSNNTASKSQKADNGDVARKSSKSQAKTADNNVSREGTKIVQKTAVSVVRSEKKSSLKQSVAKSKLSNKGITWHWPSAGVVTTNFSAKNGANKGIDIQGKKGDSVRAAALGRVVYAGSGLRGYGQLIIIKHNDVYLSAYAHNSKIYVTEGQNVKAGQHIADIGSSGSRTDSVKLHFEIRRNGQPVNPLTLLPKR